MAEFLTPEQMQNLYDRILDPSRVEINTMMMGSSNSPIRDPHAPRPDRKTVWWQGSQEPDNWKPGDVLIDDGYTGLGSSQEECQDCGGPNPGWLYNTGKFHQRRDPNSGRIIKEAVMKKVCRPCFDAWEEEQKPSVEGVSSSTGFIELLNIYGEPVISLPDPDGSSILNGVNSIRFGPAPRDLVTTSIRLPDGSIIEPWLGGQRFYQKGEVIDIHPAKQSDSPYVPRLDGILLSAPKGPWSPSFYARLVPGQMQVDSDGKRWLWDGARYLVMEGKLPK